MAIFNIKTDLLIRYDNGTSLVSLEADSFEVEIDRGIVVEQQVFARPDIGTAIIRMRKKNLSDLLTTPGYKSNMPITIEAQGYTLFSGLIQNISISYMAETKEIEITITANDFTKVFLNTLLSSFSVSGTTAARSFRNCMTNLRSAVYAIDSRTILLQNGTGGSSTTQSAWTWIDTPAGDIATQFLDAELGWMYCDVYGIMYYMTRADVNTLQATTWSTSNRTISNVHSTATTHVCMDNIDMSYNSDDLANVVTVTETASTSSRSATNATSISNYGRQEAKYDVTFDVSTIANLQTLANDIAAAANPKSVRSVSCPAVRRDGNLSSIVSVEIGQAQQVEFAATGFTTLQEIYLISRIKHNITAEHWEVTLDLWRGI